MLRKQLPIERQELVSTYNIDASFLSMVLSYENTKPWLFGGFIQIKGFTDSTQSYFYECQHESDTPFFLIQRLGKDIISCKWNDIIQFIIDCIDLNYYLLMMINKSYLDIYKDKMNKDYLHDVFIYGYDLELEQIYLAGSFLHDKYSFITCTFEEFRTAYARSFKVGLYDWLFGVILYQFRDSESHKVNPDLRGNIKTLLEHYLNSTNMTQNDFNSTVYYDRENLVYGHNVYRNIINHLRSNQDKLDVRSFNLFLDHKRIMVARFEYLIANKYLDAPLVDIGALNEILKLTEVHRNLALRFNITKDIDLKERLIEHLSKLIEKESQVYNKLISVL